MELQCTNSSPISDCRRSKSAITIEQVSKICSNEKWALTLLGPPPNIEHVLLHVINVTWGIVLTMSSVLYWQYRIRYCVAFADIGHEVYTVQCVSIINLTPSPNVLS